MGEFSDVFTRTEAPISTGWTQRAGATTMDITGSAMRATGLGASLYMYNSASSTNDHAAGIRLAVLGVTSGDYAILALRGAAAASGDYYWLKIYIGTGARDVFFFKNVGGADTAVTAGDHTFSGAWTAGDTVTITVVGSSFTIYVNAQTVHTFTDTSITTGKYMGVGNAAVAATKWEFDSFYGGSGTALSVLPSLDNFTRADENPIVGPSNAGHRWQTANPIQPGTVGGRIISNALNAVTAAGQPGAPALMTMFRQDQEIECGWTDLAASTNLYLLARCQYLNQTAGQPGLNGCWLGYQHQCPPNANVSRLIGGGWFDNTAFFTGNIDTPDLVAGDKIRLRVEGILFSSWYYHAGSWTMAHNQVVMTGNVPMGRGWVGIEVDPPGTVVTAIDFRGGELPRTVYDLSRRKAGSNAVRSY